MLPVSTAAVPIVWAAARQLEVRDASAHYDKPGAHYDGVPVPNANPSPSALHHAPQQRAQPNETKFHTHADRQ